MHSSTVNSSISSSAISPVPTATMTPNSTVHYSSATSTLNKVDSYIVQSIQLDHPIASKYTARVNHPSTSKHDPYTVQLGRSKLDSHIVRFTPVDMSTSKHDPYTVQLTQVGDATTYIEPKPSSAAVLANLPTVRVIDTSTSTLHTSFTPANSFHMETNLPSPTVDLLSGVGGTVSEKRQTTTRSIPWRFNTPISPPTVGGVSEVCKMT